MAISKYWVSFREGRQTQIGWNPEESGDSDFDTLKLQA
jgi:hypothetical protein